MPRQNRVTPFGTIIATPARGTLMGNRGCLHDVTGRIRRPYQSKRWIICLLHFKQRQRTVMAPGQYTELFFLDEATALAAGHRPCAECQRERFTHFRSLWAAANPQLANGLTKPPATLIDAILHEERLQPEKATVAVDQLPTGSFVTLDDGDAYLVYQNQLLRWRPFGYETVATPLSTQLAKLLTPPSVVRTLAAGYEVDVHESVEMLLATLPVNMP